MKIYQIPILTDNYVWIVENPNTKDVIAIDPGEADSVVSFLQSQNLELKTILITHEHTDHIGGVEKLKTHFPKVKTYWNKELKDQQSILENIKIINTPGHIKHHVSYYFEKPDWLFCGDTLFSLGCGRILEGEFSSGCQELYMSLQKIRRQTTPLTKVFCTHEYTIKNLNFTQTLEKIYQIPKEIEEQLKTRLNETQTTLPSTMGFEIKWNPFLKAQDLKEFMRLRLKRNTF